MATEEHRLRAGRLERRISRAVSSQSPLRLVWLLAFVSIVLSLTGGVVARLLAPEDFHSLGNALWWSIVTLLTIGYGDIVPTTPEGRLVGSVVMVVGVTSISAFTAIVTASFVGTHEGELEEHRHAAAAAHEEALLGSLAAIEQRLADIDAKLDQR